ncbi:MAG TPA: hypothetical protein VF042_16205 [Gemmatimonadaceae bacterium]
MKQKILFAALGAGMIAIAGCASSGTSGGTTAASSNVVLGNNARWTSRLQSVTQSRADVGQSTRDKSYGEFTWSRGASQSISSFNLVFNYSGQDRFLSWAIVAGSCGSPSLPILPMGSFPELNVGTGGRAQVNGTLSIELPTSGAYHVDIYRSRQQSMEALVACGNLKLVS